MTFSIIIITLNEEKYISTILNCLKNQTYKNFEILVVDSNSIDKTKEKALKFKEHFSEFKFIEMKKRGVSLGRNVGVENARYENLIFFDADVKIDNFFLEKLMSKISKQKIAIGTSYIKQDEFHFLLGFARIVVNFIFFTHQFFSPVALGAFIFSTKKVHKAVNGFNERIYLCEDANYVNKAFKEKFKFKVLNLNFFVNPRRMLKYGVLKTGIKYLRAYCIRIFLKKELIDNNEIEYEFGKYDQ